MERREVSLSFSLFSFQSSPSPPSFALVSSHAGSWEVYVCSMVEGKYSPLGAASTKNELEEKEESAKKAVVEEASSEREEGRTMAPGGLLVEKKREGEEEEKSRGGRKRGREKGGRERVGGLKTQVKQGDLVLLPSFLQVGP